MSKPQIAIVIGSKSDLTLIKETTSILKEFKVSFCLKILSAHRMPLDTASFARSAISKGYKVIIAAAGGAAALAGVLASHTVIPVIGIPVETKSLRGLDSLLSTVQMPSGVPVATMAIGTWGAKNAALFALEILGLTDKSIAAKLLRYRARLSISAKK